MTLNSLINTRAYHTFYTSFHNPSTTHDLPKATTRPFLGMRETNTFIQKLSKIHSKEISM